MKNYYRILGLELDAEHEEIKAAYRILAQRYHPDKGGDPAEFRLIQEAYDILGNPLTKRPYDRDLFGYMNNSALVVHNNHHNDSSNGIIWFIAILAVCGLAFAGYTYWQQYQQQQQVIKKMIALNSVPVMPPTVVAKTVTAKNTVNKNKPKSNSSSSVVSDPLANLSGTFYLLNVGSYTTLTSAQQKQTSLKNQGFATAIQKINANSEGTASYNLFMGPYKSRNTAYNIQAQLESHNIDSDLERVDSE